LKPQQPARPDYGIDAPRIGLTVVLAVAMGLAFGLGFRGSSNETARAAASVVLSLVPTGIILILLMVSYVKVEKFRHRDRILALVPWRGDEQVLDIGTGRGLLMIGAAKRLTTGKCTGIDIWREHDLSHNTMNAAMQNAEIEGVQNRVELRHADARETPFADGSFDRVLSNLCLHNIPTREGRAAACHEIARLLRPGGIALISDFRDTDEYVAAFREQGLETNRRVSFLVAPMLLRIVSATKRG
jgi:ubiquinone/menaquinone biosynthesis C-methylase UbiE